ncbi:MAG TPA: DUF4287 domain-containing protein [Chryseolinea sp.]
MSFQAYLDTIKAKTGKSPEDFKKLAAKRGLLGDGVKAGAVVAWLKEEFGVGHGHAMAIYTVFKKDKDKPKTLDDKLETFFKGTKARWRPIFDLLMEALKPLGDDLHVSPTSSYLSILRGDRKMAIIQVSSVRMDLGIKLKGIKPTKRFRSAESWNPMVTHRVQIANEKHLDKELINWLQSAYEQNARVV